MLTTDATTDAGRLSPASLGLGYGSDVLRRYMLPTPAAALAVDGEVPTVTFSTTTTIASGTTTSVRRIGNVTGANADLAGDPTFAVGGTVGLDANAASPSNRLRTRTVVGGSGQAASYVPTFRFMCDAAAFEASVVFPGATFNYRLTVDGRRSIPTATLTPGSGSGYVKYDFGTAKTRMIDLTIVDPDLLGFRVATTYNLWRPEQGYHRRLIAIGDSITGGAAGIDRHATWIWDAGALLGCDEVWNVGVGGTGWTNGGGSTTVFSDRFFTEILPRLTTRDVILFFGSRNDQTGTQAQINAITAAATPVLASVKAFPNVFVAGPITNLPAANGAVKQAAQNVGRPYIDASGWITGTGRTGAPANNGNADRYIGGSDGTDTIHPTVAGYAYLARRWANAVRALLPA